MKLLFVVQRYGREVAGGAETFCREFAERLAARGHAVTVLTSCALSYVDWADHFPPGTSHLEGVDVVRLQVGRPRDDRLFGPLHRRVINGTKPIPLHLQEAWMHMQGPFLPALGPWLSDHAGDFDVAAFFTYLYYSTWAGLPAASNVTTTLLHPTAHDEPPIYLPIFDFMFRIPDGFGYLTEEEVALVHRRFGVERPFAVTGIGVDLEPPHDDAPFRERFGVDDRYVLYVGRLDPHKGSLEMFDHFVAYKERNPSPLKLVIVGEPVRPLPPHPDIVVTGFADEATKHSALAGCELLLHPSYFESFSIVLCEAWAHRKPVLVQGHSDVLVGQARRSGGGLPYRGFREFEAALDRLLADADLRRTLGENGRDFVERRYEWDAVLGKYERFLASLVARRQRPHTVATA